MPIREIPRDELSMATRLVLLLALLHFPMVFLRFGLAAGGDGPWMEAILASGPLAALLGSVLFVWRRSTRHEAMVCVLVLAGYCLAYVSCWLGAP